MTFFSYLEKLPEKAIVAIKDPDGNYSSLYLTIDETIDKETKYKWLVISNRLSYERFFLTSQLTIQEQVLEKMLKELETESDSRLEAIHDWLCQQTDKDLLNGILKEDRTLKGAEAYCIQKAYEIRNGNGAMASHIQIVLSTSKRIEVQTYKVISEYENGVQCFSEQLECIEIFSNNQYIKIGKICLPVYYGYNMGIALYPNEWKKRLERVSELKYLNLERLNVDNLATTYKYRTLIEFAQKINAHKLHMML